MVKKDIAVLFVPGEAMFIDLEDGNTNLGYGVEDTYGLFYIADMQDKRPVEKSKDDETIRAMMATSREEYAGTELENSDHEVNNECSGTEG